MTTLISKFLEQHLYIVAQPIVDALSKEVYFYEILSRAKLDGKTYLPNDFLPDMNIHMRFRLAKHIFKRICDLQDKYPDMSFSLNISSIEIDMGIEEFLNTIFESETYNLDTSRCVIEVTEHASIDNPKTYESLKNIKSKFGFKFALDDFGSNFATLDKIYDDDGVFDYIKVDGKLVREIDKDIVKQISLHHIIKIIQGCGKKAIVEYISSEDIYKTIMKISQPDYLQGFYFGEPTDIESFAEKETAS